jgi:hypothetical protein
VLTLVILRFSAAVVMEVTYGHNAKGNETFLSSMQRAADIVLHATTVRVIAVCTVFPFGASFESDSVNLVSSIDWY